MNTQALIDFANYTAYDSINRGFDKSGYAEVLIKAAQTLPESITDEGLAFILENVIDTHFATADHADRELSYLWHAEALMRVQQIREGVVS